MRLLILTQAVDQEDLLLGFFHGWIESLASRFESVEVICLKEGKHSLPQNVQVHSLGKESGKSRATYVLRLFLYAWKLRSHYDSVFVHMNQEYVILAGLFWRFLGKRVTLWRNYPTGNLGTRIAVLFADQVLCTSKHSYTAHFKKSSLMPVGVDTAVFFPNASVTRIPRSILFLARMSPAKRVEMLIDALALLRSKGVAFSATLVGSPPSDQIPYYEGLKRRVEDAGLAKQVTFLPGIPIAEAPALHQAHAVFVNTSPSGMFDKTMFEAAACGSRVLASSKDFREVAGEDTYFDSIESLAERLEETFALPLLVEPPEYVEKHSLVRLSALLVPRL